MSLNLNNLPTTPRTIIGIALNDNKSFEKLTTEAIEQAPYKGFPKRPVLYIKPANTYANNNDEICIPNDISEVEIGACLGVVIGSTAHNLTLDNAMDHVAGYKVIADLYQPHDSFYRPAIKQKCRDGFCPISNEIINKNQVKDPNNLRVEIEIEGKQVFVNSTNSFTLSVEEVLVAITEFMTLQPGDIVLSGLHADLPTATSGQSYKITISEVGELTNLLTQAK